MVSINRYTLLFVALAILANIVASVHLQATAIQKNYPRKVGDHFIGLRKKDGTQFPIYVIGGDDASFFPKPQKAYTTDKQEYDVIILGGGLSGLTASLYLTDCNKKVLILDKEKTMGGLASWREDKRGFSYDRGAAYWTKAFNQEFQIMKHIGISRYFTQYIIPQPIDAYFWNGIIYGTHPHEGLWDDRCLGIQVPAKYKNGTSLPVLPPSFGIFKLELSNANKVQLVPDQPFQKAKKPDLDKITGMQWIRSMPQAFKQRISKPGPFARERRLLARFQQQIRTGKLNKDNPMKDVLDFMELYCRSALGANSDQLSAMGFSNFYTSEVEPRFTSPFGSGLAAKTIYEQLARMPKLATMKTETFVVKARNTATGVEVDYIQKGIPKTTRAKRAIFAAQMSMAPNIIEGLDQKSPEQAKIMRELRFAHYSVHNAEITNHPYRQAYDTWTRAKDYTVNDFSDVINGRWAELKGYREHHLIEDYEKNPDGKGNSISIYHPLVKVSSAPVDQKNRIYTDQYSAEKAMFGFNRFQELYKDYLKQDFKVLGIYTSRWPYSVHIPEKYHFTVKARKMSKTFGNIAFGNSNIGTPSFEQALFRGHCAANKILYSLDPKFVQQSWSKCEYQL